MDAASPEVISREEGLRGFYRGTHIRMMLQIPSAAICWGTYEVCKSRRARKALSASQLQFTYIWSIQKKILIQ